MIMEDKLLVALLGKIQEMIFGGEHKFGNENEYLAWCLPGAPFQKDDLQFAIKGLKGKDGEETAKLIRNAFEFSRLANSIPDGNEINSIYEMNGKMLWNVYNDVLRFSKVAKDNITESEKAKLEKFRSYLVKEEVYFDILDDEQKNPLKKNVETPMMKAYKAKSVEYNNAVLEYNNKRLAAINAESPIAVQDFAINGRLYEQKVQDALNSWVSEGYKEDVEKLSAYIKQVSQRSMSLLKADLEAQMRGALLNEPQSGSNYYITNLYPSNFINTNEGWTEIIFSSDSINKYEFEHAHNTTAQASFKFGWWTVKGGADKIEKKSIDEKLTSDNFMMKFKITQAMLGRGWFAPDFLTNQCWDWDQNLFGLLSDGKPSPTGKLPAFTTTAIFIKDIEIKSSSMDQMNSQIEELVKAGCSVNWGPINVGGSHENQSRTLKSTYDKKSNTLKIEGMQLIAFKCHKLPLTPNCKVKDLQ